MKRKERVALPTILLALILSTLCYGMYLFRAWLFTLEPIVRARIQIGILVLIWGSGLLVVCAVTANALIPREDE